MSPSFLSGHPQFLNRAFLYGESVFTTMALRNGRIFALKQNLDRLKLGLEYLWGEKRANDVQEQWPKLHESILEAINDLLKFRGKEELIVRPTLTLEQKNLGPADESGDFLFTLITAPLPPRKGAIEKLALIKQEMILDGPLKDSQLKYRLQLMRRNQKQQAVFYGQENFILEAMNANVFILINDQWVTPPVGRGVYPGLIREYLFLSLQREGINVAERQISIQEMALAQEVMLTNQSGPINWVASLENSNKCLGNKKIQKQIEEIFQSCYERV